MSLALLFVQSSVACSLGLLPGEMSLFLTGRFTDLEGKELGYIGTVLSAWLHVVERLAAYTGI